MDNEEHHPHLVNVGQSDYRNDHYKNNNEYTDKEFCVDCGCIVLITIILFSVLFFAFDKAEFDGDRRAGNFCACAACNNRCNDAKVKERLEAEARRKFVDDSIARYQVLHDSLLEAIRVKDSIDAALVNQKKIKVDFIAFIDDGITKRTVNVNSVVDTLTEEVTTQLGKTFTIMSVESAKERQKEIDRTKDYYKHLRIKTEQIL